MSEHDTKVRRNYRRVPPAEQERRARISGGRLEEDLLATLAGSVITEACGGGRAIAIAGGVDESNGRRWARGEAQNPLNRARRVIERAREPWRIVAFFAAIATRAVLRKEGAELTEWRWRALYVEAFHAEQPLDGTEDVVSQKVLLGQASIAEQIQADTRHIGALIRRLALGYIGMQKGWALAGPRPH